ncbi:endonuclease-8 [Tessaracoccus bendigoensis DSM 12906]|uniref:DNA-(apurinic or apyrimidinic site) lyase n=1 Tax=Tessaracoccus bendigoensis DSM 12906 TaxID=1123357 RepID=A0A1M6C2A6_9ACTN|nr:DNA-formamidopyrimidine glycosylase family protein [Tessaracoccus bendigoensis]SHI55185.1 endonuclease-8 [Tessaracoccus bendigoensis DSM 12906]
MPEGHVIHRLAAALTDTFGGRAVSVTSPQRRFDTSLLDGTVLERGEAVGKHLFVDFANARVVHIHLGLIGKLGFADYAEPWGQVRLRITDGVTAADLRGPQWCRLLTPGERDAVIDASGPDPLRPDADPARGYARLKRSGKSIAALLMDQRVAAGVGNIFRAEVLFRHRINPMTPGRDIDPRTWRIVWDDLVNLMGHGVVHGRIDTVLDVHGPEAQGRPARVDRHGGEVYVYRRADQPCLVCGTPVRCATLEGRNLYWCPRCQRRKSAARP